MEAVAPGALVLVATLALATAAGLLWRWDRGRFRGRGGGPEGEGPMEGGTGGPEPLTADDLGAELGERATLVQFSTAFCQPCRATRRILAEVSAMVEGVAHVEVDAESRLELVRRTGVLRTPTVLVLDARGRVVRRAVGQPRKADVIAALGDAVP